jgi:alpha-2-macroglobulin
MRQKKPADRTPLFRSKRSFFLPLLLIAISLACSLPTIRKPTPTPTSPSATLPVPTATTVPQPPTLVESQPPPGSNLPLSAAITLFFNQAMDRASVESAIRGEPTLSGRFEWTDDATLSFIPDVPLLPDTSVSLTIASSAQSQRGLTLQEPINIVYKTPGYLRLTQALPTPGSIDVDVYSAITAAFNYPVVPLGMDPADMPQAFGIDPPVQGHGEWVNTSTYIFYADPALAGGQNYNIQLNPDLKGTDGNPLESPENWSFTTERPTLLSIEPVDGKQDVSLDTKVTLTFNQPMNPESVGSSFTLQNNIGESIPGRISWSENFTTLVFTPTELLHRNESYTALLRPDIRTTSGTALGEQFQATWSVLPELTITGSSPIQNGVTSIYSGVAISITSIVSAQDALNFITIQPQVPELHAITPFGERSLQLLGNFEPETAYTLTVSAGLSDLWGSSLADPYKLQFSTAPLEANFFLTSINNVIFLTPKDTSISAQATNIGSIELSLGSVPLEDFMSMLGRNGYDMYRAYNPADVRIWSQPLDVLPNRSQSVDLHISPNGRALEPGIYMLQIHTPLPGMGLPPLLVVSNYHTTLKVSGSDALIWVTDMRLNRPAEDIPIAIYDEQGTLLASGTTDVDGIFKGQIPYSG